MTGNSMQEKLDDLQKRREEAYHAGSARSVERQHAKGKLLARERIEYLLDDGSFNELDLLARHRSTASGMEERPYTDGVITGWGTVEGRKVFVFSQDFTVFGGALGEVFAEKIHKLMDLALKVGAPVVGLNDGAGARIQEGVVSLASYGGIFYRNVLSSGVVPQISVILGPCAGGAVYSPAMTDFIFMVREASHMFITGPDVVKTVTGEDVTLEELGGAMSHASKSGVATFVSADEKSCLDDVRYLLSFLPQNNMEEAPILEGDDDPERLCPELRDLLPASPNLPYDMHKVIQAVVDDGEFMEYFPHWARSILCGFARVAGQTVGIVGNQPMVLAGVLDIESAEKAARFVRTCDAFNIPLLTFVDVPGFLPGVDQEYGGIIRHGAKLLYAYCESTVPRIQVITRKAYGGRLRRHELQVDRRRPRLRLAVRRAGRDGPAGRGGDRLPPRAAAGRRPRRPPRRARQRVHRALRQPVCGGRARLRRRRHRPRRDPPEDRRRPGDAAHQARGAAPPQARQHAVVSGSARLEDSARSAVSLRLAPPGLRPNARPDPPVALIDRLPIWAGFIPDSGTIPAQRRFPPRWRSGGEARRDGQRPFHFQRLFDPPGRSTRVRGISRTPTEAADHGPVAADHQLACPRALGLRVGEHGARGRRGARSIHGPHGPVGHRGRRSRGNERHGTHAPPR